MKNEIKIQNSKLRLVQLDYESGNSQVTVCKENLKYQFIYFISPKTSGLGILCSPLSLCCLGVGTTGGFKVNVIPKFSLSWNEAWVIEKTDTTNPAVDLTVDEKKTVISIFSEVMKDHLDTAELLCRAVKDSELLSSFYGSYGDLNNVYKLAWKKYTKGGIKNDAVIDSAPLYSSRRKYSVYDLLNDLIADKASIYTDYELIGKKYKKISRTTRDGSEYVPDKWKNIIGLIGNRTRANLNLAYYGIVSVNVPKNTFGIPEGPRELKTIKSYCIVKDGVLWTSLIGVRINSRKLIKKLKLVGAVKGELVYDNELLLDLSKLPIIKKAQTKVRPIDLARSEAGIKLAEIAQMYLRKKKWMDAAKVSVLPTKIAKPKKSDSEAFLNGLGIYGDTFVPNSVETETTETYNAYQVIADITGIPKNPEAQIRTYINNPSVCNVIIKGFLDQEVIPELKGKTYDELIEIWEKRKDVCIKRLRDLKFKLIMSKNLELYERRSPKVLNYKYALRVPNTEGKIFIKWVIKKTTIEV